MGEREIELTHYSRKPLGKVNSTRQTSEPDSKPRGLWVSDDAPYDGEAMGWPHWCEAESFGLDRLVHRHVIKLAAPERLLWLRSVAAIDEFNREFSEPPTWRYSTIRWDRVAKLYGGLVITPYQWARRLEGPARWYYTWDCASGCIWDASVVASVTPDLGFISGLSVLTASPSQESSRG